jgi:putative redox protein
MYSEAITFEGSDGQTISGRIEHPTGRFSGWAIFAHCFTCSKQSRAAVSVSRALAQRGIGVLRFDFTGIGDSDGNFAETGFSTNVADIEAAANFMGTQGRNPTLLIGHSLGGAAALVAASRLEAVKAVATIGAPSSAAHVVGQFDEQVDTIEREGEADVTLAGRPFRVKRQMLSDLRSARVLDAVSKLAMPVLFMHAPSDGTVGIEHATELFTTARHPKSFVSLDNADHFLLSEADTDYVGNVIAGWAGRYISMAGSGEEGTRLKGDVVVQETAGIGPYQNEVLTRNFRQIIDEPRKLGGSDTGPDPYSMLSGALGGCTSITLRMYADRKDWPVDQIRVAVSHERTHADDCKSCEPGDKVDVFTRNIHVSGDLTEEQTARLLEIADKCPVHRTLESSSVIRSSIERKLQPDQGVP